MESGKASLDSSKMSGCSACAHYYANRHRKPYSLDIYSKEEILRRLVDLQESDDTFALSDDLAKLLGRDKNKLEKFIPAGRWLKLDTHLQLWGTALAIALMEIVLADLKVDWQLMCNKAHQQALNNQLMKETGLDMDLNTILAAAIKEVNALGGIYPG